MRAEARLRNRGALMASDARNTELYLLFFSGMPVSSYSKYILGLRDFPKKARR